MEFCQWRKSHVSFILFQSWINTAASCEIDIHGEIYKRRVGLPTNTWQRWMHQDVAWTVGPKANDQTGPSKFYDRKIWEEKVRQIWKMRKFPISFFHFSGKLSEHFLLNFSFFSTFQELFSTFFHLSKKWKKYLWNFPEKLKKKHFTSQKINIFSFPEE